MPMRRRSRTDQLTEILRTRIQRGHFPVGSKLPSEQALAADFEVSRTVVREAIARLKSDGVIETRKGAATRVCAAGRRMTSGLFMPGSIGSLLGFLEVRRPIEAEMAALAAERRTEAQCLEIENALLSIDRSMHENGNGVDEDLDFHLAIGRATSNAYWNQFVHLFAEPMRAAIGVTRANEARRQDFARAVAGEHRRIYEAIRGQHPEQARMAAHLHLRNAAARIMQADQKFWEQEGGGLAQDWARRSLSDAEDHGRDLRESLFTGPGGACSAGAPLSVNASVGPSTARTSFRPK